MGVYTIFLLFENLKQENLKQEILQQMFRKV